MFVYQERTTKSVFYLRWFFLVLLSLVEGRGGGQLGLTDCSSHSS